MDGGDFKQRMSIAAKLAGNATELSRKTGISRRAIGTYLAGCSDPTRERLIAIANASGVSVEWLATGLGNKPCALKEPLVSSSESKQSTQQTPVAEIPIPLYVIKSEEFAHCDGNYGESVEVLYMRTETLLTLDFSDLVNLKAIYLDGERVTPLGVGHTLLVDFNPDLDKALEAGVYLLRKGGELRTSAVYPNGARYFRYINYDDDATEIFDPERAEIKIIGRVIWSCGRAS